MRKLALLALSLLAAPAWAALPTVTINGNLMMPDGVTAPSSGRITCRLSQAGSALDGGTSMRLASEWTMALGAGGAVSFTLVPNDQITPSGTAYICTIQVRSPALTSAFLSWSETWQLASSPSPIAIGAVPRLNVIPGVAIAPVPLSGDLGGTYLSPQVTGTHLGSPLAESQGGTAASSLGAGSVTATDSTTARALADHVADLLSVLNFIPQNLHAGIKNGTNVTDLQPYLQNAIDSSSVFFPCGTYQINSSIVLNGVGPPRRILGSGFCSKIVGNFAGYLLDKQPTVAVEGPYVIEGLYLSNLHVSGGGIRLNGYVVASISKCRIEARSIGIDLSSSTFSTSVSDCLLRGTGNIGWGVLGPGTFTNLDVVGWDEGIRLWGSGAAITGGRYEVNRIAIHAGRDGAGAINNLSRAIIAGVGMEANDTGIQLDGCNSVQITGVGHQGSTNAPSGRSKYGLRSSGGCDAIVVGSIFDGAYTNAAIKIDSPDSALTFIRTTAANSYGGSGATDWDIGVNPDVLTVLGRSGSDLSGKNAAMVDFVPSFSSYGLAQIDMMKGTVAAKNLRGKDLAVGAAATTLAITFPPSRTAGEASLYTLTPSNSGGSLSGTYYYCATLVTPLGESSCIEASVTVTVPNNAVTVSFFGIGGDQQWRRRVYRGTATGVYDGFYELPIASSASYLDTGAAFSGIKQPPATASPSGIETDASYSVTCSPQWNASCWVTAKATTGFTLNFSAAPGGGGSFVDWHLIR